MINERILNWFNGSNCLDPKNTSTRYWMRSQLREEILCAKDKDFQEGGLEIIKNGLLKRKSRFLYLLLLAHDKLDNKTIVKALKTYLKLRKGYNEIDSVDLTLTYEIMSEFSPRQRLYILDTFTSAILDMSEDEVNSLLFTYLNKKEVETRRDDLIRKIYNVTPLKMKSILVPFMLENYNHTEIMKRFFQQSIKSANWGKDDVVEKVLLFLRENTPHMMEIMPQELVDSSVRRQIDTDLALTEEELYHKIKEIGKLEELKAMKDKSVMEV